jgi:carbon monoxide dehydrogenase subunit G
MTEIKSKEVVVSASADELRHHLADLRHLEPLLPADKVKGFSGSEDEVSFKIQGGLEIRLTRTSDAFEGSVLRLQGGGAPFSFHLDLHVVEEGSGARAHVCCEADLNPFLRMMAQKPLEALFQHIAGAVETRFGAA